jgi:hypothetical protein
VSGEGKLWLSVNDWVIDRESPERIEADRKLYASAAPYKDDNGAWVSQKDLEERWDGLLMSKPLPKATLKVLNSSIPQGDARDPFFEDNIGDFLIEINVR